MKLGLLILLLLWASPVKGEMKIGPSIDFLSIPHPLNIRLNLQSNKFNYYLKVGAFRTLYEDNEPIGMKNISLGFQYHISPVYIGLETGKQELKIYQGTATASSKYINPLLGYNLYFKSGLFLQSEVGYQFNFEHKNNYSNLKEAKALNRFSEGNFLSFTLLRLGYFF